MKIEPADITVSDLESLKNNPYAKKIFDLIYEKWVALGPGKEEAEAHRYKNSRVGTLYTEVKDGHLEVKLVTRFGLD